MKTRRYFAGPLILLATVFAHLGCCPHSAPPPLMGPPPAVIEPGWPSDPTCFENTLLWTEDGAIQVFNGLIGVIPEQVQGDFKKAKDEVDSTNAIFIKAMNAYVATKEGDFQSAMSNASAAVVRLVALVQQFESGVSRETPLVAGSPAAPTLSVQAKAKLDQAKVDLAKLQAIKVSK